MNASNHLGENSIKSLFFKYYIPALTSLLSITLHQIINGIILANQVGKDGLAAVGLYGPVVIVFIALALPVMIGGSILIGKNIGAKNYTNAQNIFRFATTLGLLVGGTMAVCSPFLITPIAHFLAGQENAFLVNNTSDYILWQLIALPFFFLGMFWGSFISQDGAPKISRNASLIAVTVNITLDLILIVGLHLGVKGASIATAISMLASALYLFFFIQNGKSHYTFIDFKFTVKLTEWKELLNLAFPSFASEISFSSGLLLISHSVIPYGSVAVSVFGMVNYLSFIFIRLFTSAMIASMRIISFNIGANLASRVLEVLRFSLVFTFLLGLIIAAFGFISPHVLFKFIFTNESEEFKQMASRAIMLYFILFIAAGPNYILSAYLQSIGKPVVATVINISKGFVLIVLLLTILPGYFKMGLSGIWLSRSLAEIITFMLVGIYTFSRRRDYYSETVVVRR